MKSKSNIFEMLMHTICWAAGGSGGAQATQAQSFKLLFTRASQELMVHGGGVPHPDVRGRGDMTIGTSTLKMLMHTIRWAARGSGGAQATQAQFFKLLFTQEFMVLGFLACLP
jgi:hypothetical protein